MSNNRNENAYEALADQQKQANGPIQASNGQFEERQDCEKSGQHLKSVDRDGYCNMCGFQESTESETLEEKIDVPKRELESGFADVEVWRNPNGLLKAEAEFGTCQCWGMSEHAADCRYLESMEGQREKYKTNRCPDTPLEKLIDNLCPIDKGYSRPDVARCEECGIVSDVNEPIHLKDCDTLSDDWCPTCGICERLDDHNDGCFYMTPNESRKFAWLQLVQID